MESLIQSKGQDNIGTPISEETYRDFLELPIHKISEGIIKVYDYKYLKGKLGGYIWGKCYFNERYRGPTILKGNTVDFGNEVHALRDDNVITVKYKFDNDDKIYEAEYFRDDEIYAKYGFYNYSDGKDRFLVKISRESGEFFDKEGELLLKLEGDYRVLDLIDFIGIALYYLELFV